MDTTKSIAHIIHMRCYEADDKEQTNPIPHGGATVAWAEVPTESEDICLVHVAIARCHANDNYCRRIGRAVAIGKLNNQECFPLQIDVDQLDAVYDLVIEFANMKMDEWEEIHQRVLDQRAAAAELRRLKREETCH